MLIFVLCLELLPPPVDFASVGDGVLLLMLTTSCWGRGVSGNPESLLNLWPLDTVLWGTSNSWMSIGTATSFCGLAAALR